MKDGEIKIVNGYSIQRNDFWGLFNVSHNEIGVCGYFIKENDAIEFCKNG